MSAFDRAWKLASTAATFYTVYRTLSTLQTAKDDLYKNLSPGQQEQWRKVMGDPEAKLPQLPQIPPPTAILAKLPKSVEGAKETAMSTVNQIQDVAAGL